MKKLGIRSDNLASSFIPYLLFTIFGVFAIILLARILGKNPLPNWWTYSHFQFYFVPVSIFQEFFYRGFLMPKLKSLTSSSVNVIIINALLFMVLHIIFPDPAMILPLTFISGIAWATIYTLYPNLILISISHTVLNFTAVLYCFASFITSC